ncbi:MAG TPA: hypothetical protein VF192_02415 [Longimicrobiales bacterium]
MHRHPSARQDAAASMMEAVNPALVLSDDGPDLLAALGAAGFATRLARTPRELHDALGAGEGDIATPPLILVDLRRGLSPASVSELRQREGRLPILAVADDPATARAAADAGANATLGSAELGPRLAELVNLLLRMATLW